MLKTRVITAVIALIAVGIVLFVIPPLYTELVIGLLMVAGAWEWAGFLDTESNTQRLIYTGLISAALIGVWLGIEGYSETILLIACIWWVLAFFWNLRFPTPIPNAVRWICGFLVIVPLFLALILLLRQGVEYLIFTLLIVWVADGGAYFAGKAFGRVKLAPAISPARLGKVSWAVSCSWRRSLSASQSGRNSRSLCWCLSAWRWRRSRLLVI